MSRRERRAASKRAKADLNRLALTVEPALCKAALAHMGSGRHLDAQLCCHKALEASPEHPELLHLMALVCLNAKQFDHAVEWASRAIGKDPMPAYLTTLGTALQKLSRLDDALKVFDKAVQLKPDDPELWTNLGALLEEAKRPSEAVLCFEHSLNLDPAHLEAACASAVLLHQLGRLEEALARFDLCETLRPQHALTQGARALVLRDLKRHDEYLAAALQAHALDPNNSDLCNNAGDAFMLLRRFEEALEYFDSALELRPSFLVALKNKAWVLKNMHRFKEVFATHDRMRRIDPTDAEVEFASANLNLLLGNFKTGWREREVRWRMSGLPNHFPDGPEPVWLGEENLEGKAILIYSDEGLGDAIQFTRYIPMLADRGARVILVVQESLRSLLSTLPGLSQCLATSTAALPPVDFRCPLTSLPLAFGTTLDTVPPPIRLSPLLDRARAWQERLEERLGAHDRLRVGLTWSGSPTHPNDRTRSIPLQLLTSILDVDVNFLSLQKDPRPADKTVLERTGIVDLSAEVADFSDTAALVSCLDLVITVDTSVAHLAGTMGCPTWIMLRYTPDFRWLLDRDDSPWYPTVRLFRQSETRDYGSVIERVRTELTAAAEKWREFASELHG
jgi:tetratricopeptide (TPR) repeat protein